ncbi:pentatricopeptide repeat-containing protein At1g71460, chloroplastic [Vigna radiata var. radiata]|uniref:Pentatricopeptide repeat-containing protein At1g71460, chloroplastic n=1 Tax=Vigna radiata var. radiata TaxID=3916 RepID=A0A1S3VA36_VIGRR|nr:pentatricopeptide repeat-containing protein At1g71460, chloroplastic [Vigna radiata var. radiata]XP_022641891.1 pentatricopeptide repeat-containing protein At1g71460, chloroplastic [Vigna radiata var. radiata]XP_022641892.1 pentatricopeptide repeat-containing protein At1g71460, chloroplastic [Vigna radiata var. radiata]XP_022641893.1 pentatricopeptide repeat-containing protein At1g71460, chloroplastic [Vigna radiata var. radiata]XP_022641894.1 pentatricopeptide repeat-containing protein At1g
MFSARLTNAATSPCFKHSSEIQSSVSLPLSLHPHSFILNSATRHTLSLSTPQNHALPLQPPRSDDAPPNETRLNKLYLNRRKTEFSRQVFDKIPKRDVKAWKFSIMIARFARNGMIKEVLDYTRLMLVEGINPNLFLMTVILDGIGKVGARNLGREAHGFVVKNMYYKELSILSALIDMYRKCGDVGSGSLVLFSVMERKGDFWIGLVSGRLEIQMRSVIRLKRFRPGAAAVASLLPICAQLRALKQGKEIHAYSLRHWLLPNVPIVSSLMVLYSKCGVIEYSIKLFDEMERKNVVSWTAMIDSYIENGRVCETLGVMRSMAWTTEHKPDTVTMARMLHVCGELKVLKLGKEVHGQVLKRGFASVHYVAAGVIDMYGICGDVDKAKLVFSLVPDKGSTAWSALIRAYGHKEWYQEAIDIFDDMISNGCSPNRFTFEAVLSICDRAGYVEDSFRIFDLMSRYKIEASKEHCTCMIRLLTRYGKLDEAQRYLEMSSSL